MYKVTALCGSARKAHTYGAIRQFLDSLEARGGVTGEIIVLSEENLKPCRGCKLCIDRGEELCPLGDDGAALISRLEKADGVIIATPNYSFHVSGHTKLFLDRLGYLFHRPRMFGKTFTSLVTQGIYGGGAILRYLNFVGGALGYNTIKGSCLNTLEPQPEKVRLQNERKIDKQARRFYKTLGKQKLPVPSLLKLVLFRLSRTSMKKMLGEEFRDYIWYREKGWFDSDYYYPVKLNPIKKIAASLVDVAAGGKK